MRHEGILTKWNDARGFGFIAPDAGGDDIFVHVSAFPKDAARPGIGHKVAYELETAPDGRPRAVNIRPLGVSKRAIARQWLRPDRLGLLAIPAFVAIYIAVAVVWSVPSVFAAIYLLMSVICFLGYAIDKYAAVHDSWRMPEHRLLGVGLFGGWPGALLAQQFLHHKTRKRSFLTGFWITVVVNVVVFVLLNSPSGLNVSGLLHRAG